MRVRLLALKMVLVFSRSMYLPRQHGPCPLPPSGYVNACVQNNMTSS